jgi:hypothetical protein
MASISINKFFSLAKFKDDGSTRLVIDQKSDLPRTARFSDAGAKSFGAGRGEYFAVNALFVDRLENELKRAFDNNKKLNNNGRSALSFLSRFHQGGSAFRQRDMLNLVLILTADRAMLEKYILLQGLADRICGDERFINLIKAAFPGKARSAKQAVSKDTLKKLGNATGVVIPPVGLITKCFDICNLTDQLEAAKHVRNLGKLFEAPLVELLGEILYETSWGQLNAKGLNVTLSTVGIGLGMGSKFVSPGLAVIKASGEAHMSHGVPLGVAHLDLAASGASKLAKAKASDLLTPTVSLSLPLPVFPVRRDRSGPETSRPLSGRNVIYSLYDRKVVVAFISYLTLPIGGTFVKKKEQPDSPDELLNNVDAQEEARLIFKNLLGSPNKEDALLKTPRGMAPEEYIFYKFKNDDMNPWHVPERLWPGVVRRRSAGNQLRPPSFVRLLAVAIGLTDEHKGGPSFRNGKGFRSQMAAAFTTPSTPMWCNPQEADFDKTLAAGTGLKEEYRALPWMTCCSNLTTALPPEASKFDIVEPPPLETLLSAIEKKNRWVCDWETPNCSVCNTPLSKFSRHHCRACGKMMCSKDTEEISMLDKELNTKKRHKVCRNCASNKATASLAALREGDVCTQ